jgi:hypothetical protein
MKQPQCTHAPARTLAHLLRLRGSGAGGGLVRGFRNTPTLLSHLFAQVVHRFEGAAPAAYVLELAAHHFHGGPEPRDVRSLMQ